MSTRITMRTTLVTTQPTTPVEEEAAPTTAPLPPRSLRQMLAIPDATQLLPLLLLQGGITLLHGHLLMTLNTLHFQYKPKRFTQKRRTVFGRIQRTDPSAWQESTPDMSSRHGHPQHAPDQEDA